MFINNQDAKKIIFSIYNNGKTTRNMEKIKNYNMFIAFKTCTRIYPIPKLKIKVNLVGQGYTKHFVAIVILYRLNLIFYQ